jgi:hypothetical protein
VDEVDEDDASQADDWQGGEDDQRHGPAQGDSDGGSAGEHGEEVEHAADLLASGLLIGEGVLVELRAQLELVVAVEPPDVLPQQALHVGLPAADGHALAQHRPAGEGDPGTEERPQSDIEKDVAVVDGVVEPLLCVVCVEEGVEDLAPEVGEPGEAAPRHHRKGNAEPQQHVVVTLSESE